MLSNLKIRDREIGYNCPSYVIAEIGSNHNQDWDLALRMIDAAADAGADAVKFQTFKADNHVSKYAKMPSYLMKGESTQELLRTLELNRNWQEPLQRHAEDRGVHFFSSPCDYEAADELAALDVPAMKIASFDLPDAGLISYIAAKGKPVILSTGLANWMDIQRGVDACRTVGNNDIIVLQCTSLYPAPIDLTNLRSMDTMRQAMNVLTGYSDHTMGDIISCAAVARGACVIEKHFTLDRTLPGPDHSFAMEPDEFKLMMQRIREIESAIGDGFKNGPRGAENEMADAARRSIHAARDIAPGEVLTSEMFVIKRPGQGIPPHMMDELIGRTAREHIPQDHWISWSMV